MYSASTVITTIVFCRRRRIEYTAGYSSKAHNSVGQFTAISNLPSRLHAQVQSTYPLQIHVQSRGHVGGDDSVSPISRGDARCGEKD